MDYRQEFVNVAASYGTQTFLEYSAEGMGLRLCRDFQGFEMEALIGRRSILSARTTIEAFRRLNDQDHEVLTSVDCFLSKRVVWNELPVVLLCRIKGRLQGIVLLYYSKIYWLPYGLARAGKRGDVSMIGPSTHQRQILETAAQFIVRHLFAHTVVFTVPDRISTPIHGRSNGRISLGWFFRENGYRLSLEGGWAATMQRLSYKLRRNLLYYRKRASIEAKVHFIVDLTAAQRSSAVAALATKGRYPVALPLARTWDDSLQGMPGAFAMGLQNARGDWLSYVVGWRERSATYVDLQLNEEIDSASTIMRSYLIEHETGRESPALVFVGGVAPIWRRACEPAIACDLLVTSTGPISHMLQKAYQRLKPGSDVSVLYRRKFLDDGQLSLTADDELRTLKPLS